MAAVPHQRRRELPNLPTTLRESSPGVEGSRGTWAPTMIHTPEPGSGVEDIAGPSLRITAPRSLPPSRRPQFPNPSSTPTPDSGSGMRDADSGTHSPCSTGIVEGRTHDMYDGFYPGKAPDSRARLGSAEPLPGHDRQHHVNKGEGNCRRMSSIFSSGQPHEPTETMERCPVRGSAPDSRARLGSGEHLSRQGPYLAATAERALLRPVYTSRRSDMPLDPRAEPFDPPTPLPMPPPYSNVGPHTDACSQAPASSIPYA